MQNSHEPDQRNDLNQHLPTPKHCSSKPEAERELFILIMLGAGSRLETTFLMKPGAAELGFKND